MLNPHFAALHIVSDSMILNIHNMTHTIKVRIQTPNPAAKIRPINSKAKKPAVSPKTIINSHLTHAQKLPSKEKSQPQKLQEVDLPCSTFALLGTM